MDGPSLTARNFNAGWFIFVSGKGPKADVLTGVSLSANRLQQSSKNTITATALNPHTLKKVDNTSAY